MLSRNIINVAMTVHSKLEEDGHLDRHVTEIIISMMCGWADEASMLEAGTVRVPEQDMSDELPDNVISLCGHRAADKNSPDLRVVPHCRPDPDAA